MQADRSRTPEQNLAHDLGLLEADLERIVRHERARDRAERLVEAVRRARLSTAQIRFAADIGKTTLRGKIRWYERQLEQLGNELDPILAEIDAPIGGGA